MKLLTSQKNMLADLIEAAGADINCFDIKESEYLQNKEEKGE